MAFLRSSGAQGRNCGELPHPPSCHAQAPSAAVHPFLNYRPYIFDALQLLESAPAEYFPDSRKPDSLDFVHLPIVDCATVGDSKVFSLAKDLCRRLKAGENLYVHCWGGHGRTGTVLSLMLGLVYGLGPMEAMAWVQMFHDCRIAPCGVPSPQTTEQRKQVTRILVKLSKKRDAEAAHAAAQQVAQEASRAKARQAAEAAARQSVASATTAKHAAHDPFAHYRQQPPFMAPSQASNVAPHEGRATPDALGRAHNVPPVALMGASLAGEHSGGMTGPATERLPHSTSNAAPGMYQSSTARSSSGSGRHTAPIGSIKAWDPTPERALSRAKSPDTARAGSGLGRSTPGSPPPARTGSSSSQVSFRAGASSRGGVQTPPVPQGGTTAASSSFFQGRQVPAQAHMAGTAPASQFSGREDSIDAKPPGKMRRTGRSYEPVGRTRGEMIAAEASMNSVTSDLPPAALPEHAEGDEGGQPHPPASRVHLPSAHGAASTVPAASTAPALPLGGTKPPPGTGASLPSTGSAGSTSLMWKQPEVESWVNRLSGRRKPKAASTSRSGSGSSSKPSSDVMRLVRRSRHKRDGDTDSTTGSSSGFGHVRSKVPSRRVGGKKKTRSSSKRKGRRSSSRARGTPATPEAVSSPARAAGAQDAAGSTSLLGVLPSIPDGRPGSGVVAGAGVRGMNGVGNTRNMLTTPAQPAGGMFGYSHHQAAMASDDGFGRGAVEGGSTGAASSTGGDEGMAPSENTQHSRRGAMQSHRRLVSAHPAPRKTSTVASRGSNGARSLKPPPVSVG